MSWDRDSLFITIQQSKLEENDLSSLLSFFRIKTMEGNERESTVTISKENSDMRIDTDDENEYVVVEVSLGEFNKMNVIVLFNT